MGVDQLVSGGDVDNPVYESLETDSATVDGTTTTDSINDSNGDATLGESVASGSVQLSSGDATVDTGVGAGTTATFYVALGPDTDDVDVGAEVRSNSGGNYVVDVVETDSAVGNPTINYDIVRVR